MVDKPTINSQPSGEPKYWAIVPAAGVGARMEADRPKQYLSLAGRAVIEHSLDRLLNHPRISGGVVAISEGDAYWARLGYKHQKPLQVAPGGAERCHSVLNALYVLANVAAVDDWVLVHDAARPCLRSEDITRLIDQCKDHPVGGILGIPVKDTIKQAEAVVDTPAISATVDRSLLWHAQTPQMFRLSTLHFALEQALSDKVSITDEASALEHSDQWPLLVEGHADNIKLTRPEDLPLLEFFLSQFDGSS